MADLDRIKRNVSKMAEMNAPESDIDGYIASEGVTLEQVRNHKLNTQEPQPIVVPELKDRQGNVVTEENIDYGTEKTLEGKASKRNFRPASFAKSLGKGFVHGVSSLGTGLGKNVVNPLREKIGKKPLTDYELENMYGSFLGLKEDGGAYKTGKVVGEIAPFMILPEAKVAQLGTVGNAALTNAYQGALGSGLASVAQKGLDPKENLKDTAIGTLTGAVLGGAIGKGGQIIARNKRAKEIAKRRNTPLIDRMSDEQLENFVNKKPTEPSQYGVADIDSAQNEAIAKQIQGNISAEEEILSGYNQLHSDLVKKYGSIENLETRALSDLEAQNDLGILRGLEEDLQSAKYVPSTTSDYGVANIDSARNKEIADTMNEKVREAFEQIKQYESFRKEVERKYGSIENIRKILAQESDEFGRVQNVDMQQDFDKLIEMQKSLTDNPYFEVAKNINPRNTGHKQAIPKKQDANKFIEEQTPVEEPIITNGEVEYTPTQVAQKVDDVIPEQVAPDFNNAETDFIEQAKKQVLENNLPSHDDAYIYSDNDHSYLRSQIEAMRDANYKHAEVLKNLEEQKNNYLAKAKSEKRIKEINEAYNQRVKEVNDILKNSQQKIIKNIDNYKKEIDVVPEQVVQAVPEQILPSGKKKKSTLAQKAEKSPEVAKSVEENPPMYQSITNAETTAQAQREIAENIDKVQTDILRKLTDENSEVTALDVEKSRQLFAELQKQGRYDDAIDLLERTSKQGSKLGQAVQAFSLWSKTTPDGAKLFAQKLLDKYNKGVRKKLQKHISEEDLNKIGKKFEELEQSGLTGRELEVATAKAMKEVYNVVPKTFAQKLDGYRYISMLLSPQSRIKDFILTAKNASDTAIDETLAGGIDYLRTLGSKDKTRYISANPFAGTKEWLQGAKKGLKEGVEDVRYGINTSRSGEVGRYGLPNTPTFKEANFEGGWLDRANTLIGNPLGSAEKLLRYTLQVPDRMFFEARYASSLANQMKARGVTEPTQDMINRSVEEAKRAVFQENRPITEAMQKGAELIDTPIHILENNIGLPQGTLPTASKGLAPFVKTPTNVIAQGAEGLHGLGSGWLKRKSAIENGDAEAIREAELLMGRGLRGAGELGLGFAVGKGLWDKIKTNIGEKDYYANEITGLQPSSLVIGDKAFSMQNMQNNLPFFTGVGLGQNGLGKAFTNTTDIIAEMPALKALGDLYNINKEANYIAQSEDPDKELLKKGSRAARSLGANYLTTLIPFGGWLGELRNDIDPYARELYAPDRYDEGVLQGLGSDAEYLKNRVQNRIPGLSTLLPNRYNSLGQPIMSNNIDNDFLRGLSQAVNFGVRNYNEPPAEMEEMQRIQDYAMKNNIEGKTTLKFAKPKRYIGRGKDKTRLTNEQYSELTRLYNGKVYDELQFLMNTPEYQSADEETKIKWVKEVLKEKKKESEEELFGTIK